MSLTKTVEGRFFFAINTEHLNIQGFVFRMYSTNLSSLGHNHIEYL